jgi:hypothetical protein
VRRAVRHVVSQNRDPFIPVNDFQLHDEAHDLAPRCLMVMTLSGVRIKLAEVLRDGHASASTIHADALNNDPRKSSRRVA